MQTAAWYVRRLRAMSSREVAWRVRAAFRDATDRVLLPLRRHPSALAAAQDVSGPGFRVSSLAPGAWAALPPGDPAEPWYAALTATADKVAMHRLQIFDCEELRLGQTIDWNRDPKSGVRAPMRFGPWIDYRDFAVAGDVKFVWELNRHHHLVVLGRAWRASGERLYAEALREQLASWLERCPFETGINWRSPLELAIRLINWVFALDLVHESGAIEGGLAAQVREAVFLQLREITRRYSRESSANNHLVGEAAGVFVATSYFRDLPEAAVWRSESREILCEQILAQTHEDGGLREQALGYHLFVLEMLLVVGLVARRRGERLTPEYWARLEKMLDFVRAVAEGGDELPMFGDYDEGRILDLGGAPGDPRAMLAAGAALFGRADMKAASGELSEAAFWLLGPSSQARLESLAAPPEGEPLASQAFPETGLYLLQCGVRGSLERLSATFDCGPLGFGQIAAHGHADALSFTLRAFGEDVFVDPGTYDYFTFPEWRDYFRSTRAHNTVVVDGADQSEMQGPFLWGERARAFCNRFEPTPQGGLVTGGHDGYMRLPAKVLHMRTLELDGASRLVTLRDEISSHGTHEIAVHFHLAEHCRVEAIEENRVKIETGRGTVLLEMDPRLEIRTLVGGTSPIGGWVSRGYHRKTPSTTIVGSCSCEGGAVLVSRISVGAPRD